MLYRHPKEYVLGLLAIVGVRPNRCYRDSLENPTPTQMSGPVKTLNQRFDSGPCQIRSLFADRLAFRVEERQQEMTRIVGVFGQGIDLLGQQQLDIGLLRRKSDLRSPGTG